MYSKENLYKIKTSLIIGDRMDFNELSELERHAQQWDYEFYKEETYRYICFAIEPHPKYKIRALYYSKGNLLTLAELANEDEFRGKPKILSALKMGPFDGH
jgi:hypothetical protein